jgi:hypothetical protein
MSGPQRLSPLGNHELLVLGSSFSASGGLGWIASIALLHGMVAVALVCVGVSQIVPLFLLWMFWLNWRERRDAMRRDVQARSAAIRLALSKDPARAQNARAVLALLGTAPSPGIDGEIPPHPLAH